MPKKYSCPRSWRRIHEIGTCCAIIIGQVTISNLKWTGAYHHVAFVIRQNPPSHVNGFKEPLVPKIKRGRFVHQSQVIGLAPPWRSMYVMPHTTPFSRICARLSPCISHAIRTHGVDNSSSRHTEGQGLRRGDPCTNQEALLCASRLTVLVR